jgi:hypothetical protein
MAFGHVRAQSGWDATGFCALEGGTNAMCTATNGGNFYWGYQASATVMNSVMQVDGATGNFHLYSPTGPTLLWNGATGVLTVNGTNYASSERFKKDIHFLDQGELDDALHMIDQTPVARYRYKTAVPGSKPIIGVIAEHTPTAMLSDDGNAVNIMSTVGVLMAAV